MPTGYTAKLVSEGESFRDFIMHCARAFGACVTMRDDASDAEIPEKFEPSEYYINNANENKKELDRLTRMSSEESIQYGDELKRAEVESAIEYHKKNEEENERLGNMEIQVMAWIPPTKDHQGLKDFMLNQIRISKNDTDWTEKRIKDAEAKTPEAYFIEAVSTARRNINYYANEQAKEIERVISRNEWIRQLRESIPTLGRESGA